ncbi:MAG: hypothetical protein AAFV27_05880 [Pseudomonadota bacterium]
MTRAVLTCGLLIALGACGTAPEPLPRGPFTPVVWKEGVGVQTRATDLGQCELFAAGSSASASQAAIEAAARSVTAEDRAERLAACLRGRGYTVTEGQLCSAADLASGPLQQKSRTDALPPLSRVRCHDPSVDGFVTF